MVTPPINKQGFLGPLALLVVFILMVGASYIVTSEKFFNGAGFDLIFSPQATLAKTQQWIDCDDVREVIEDQGRLYLACLGGVLVVDASTKKVVDQISMADGLSDSVTTDLVKKGETLYIGTQDGFTIFNLQTRQAKKISVGQGLVNGSNIILAEDGDDLWVGTFNGLAKYNTQTGQIINYTKELGANSTSWSVNRLLVTDRAIYATVTANAYSDGGVARWDKKTATWENWGPSAFLDNVNQYSRVDFFSLVQAGSKVLMADFSSKAKLYEADNAAGASWARLDQVSNEIMQDKTASIYLRSDQNTAWIVSSDSLYKYLPEQQKAELVYPKFTEGTNVLSGLNSIGQIQQISNNRLWISVDTGKQRPLISWLDLANFQSGQIDLINRPIHFSGVVAVVDDQVIVQADGSLWSYNFKTGGFKKLPISDFVEGGARVFRPIPGSQKILIFVQNCGMGCDEPKFLLYDYQAGSVTPIELPTEIMGRLTINLEGAKSYSWVAWDTFDETTGQFVFTADLADQVLRLFLNSKDNSWKTEEEPKHDTPPPPEVSFCNPNYSFASNGKKFTTDGCVKGTVENSQFRWLINHLGYGQDELWQEDKTTGEKIKLTPAATPPKYSPFPDWKDPQIIRSMTYAQGSLWLGTNRGLAAYNPASAVWKLIGIGEGLPANDVANFVVAPRGVVWAVSLWGGLAGVVYK